MTDKNNEYLFRMTNHMRLGLAEVDAKVNALYRVEELEDYLDIKDSPIEHIKAALMPLIGQVNDFHDYAETVANRMELNLEDVDVYALLESVLTIVERLLEDKPAVMLEEDAPENLPTIEGDPARLSQVLLNLLHNAVKFTDKGYITVRIQREKDKLLFEIQDTGIGIAEDDQELIFEPFETILEDKEDPRLGFGIGLKLVEHIIDLHDGETWFESEYGKGSSFFFTIPL